MRFILIMALLALPVAAQQMTEAEVETIAERMEGIRAKTGIPAISIAVARGGEVVHAAAFGLADVELDVSATPESLFRTASIAKPMTAVAIMRLVEQGKIDLDAPIRDYVEAWPEKHPKITCRQLLAHIGGVRHYKLAAEAAGTRLYPDLESTLELFAEDDLVAEPGTTYRYTTFGYTLLGLAIESVTGKAYLPAMRELVFARAGMKHTTIDSQLRILKGRTRGYRKLSPRAFEQLPEWKREGLEPGGLLNAQLHDTSMKIPGGGLVTTAADLARFGLAMRSGKLVKPETRELMWTPQKTTDGAELRYGLGWQLVTMEEERLAVHGGAQAGTACMLVVFRDSDLVISVMTNMRGANVRQIALEVGTALDE